MVQDAGLGYYERGSRLPAIPGPFWNGVHLRSSHKYKKDDSTKPVGPFGAVDPRILGEGANVLVYQELRCFPGLGSLGAETCIVLANQDGWSH